MTYLNVCISDLPVGLHFRLCRTDKFYRYSALYWAELYRFAAITDVSDDLFRAMKQFPLRRQRDQSVLYRRAR